MYLDNEVILKEATVAGSETTVSRDQAVLASCLEALRREEAGDYDSARMLLTEYWPGVGEKPNVEGLGDKATAELLLRSGALSGKIGRAHQIKGAQEIAKDLISHSARLYEVADNTEKVTEAQLELAICYWREGALDEARDTLNLSVQSNPNLHSDQRLKSMVTLGIFESSASRYREALRIYGEVAPLLKDSNNHLLRGSFHNQYALAYKNIGAAENRTDYTDRAFIEFAAAGYHFEQAAHTRYLALVENNLGFLFLSVNKPLEAHQHLNRARALFGKVRDKGMIAQVDETRARAFLAQGLYSQAETTVRTAVRAMEQGDEKSVLAETLITFGVALCRLERPERAYEQLKRAISVANQAGDDDRAGLAALTIVENLASYVQPLHLRRHYEDAERLLLKSQSPDTEPRLGRSARLVLAMQETRPIEPESTVTGEAAAAQAETLTTQVAKLRAEAGWSGCSLEDEVLRYEGELIHRALESVGGSVTRAARLLGITHQGLAFILNGRHKSLLAVRTPVRHRRKSIFKPE